MFITYSNINMLFSVIVSLLIALTAGTVLWFIIRSIVEELRELSWDALIPKGYEGFNKEAFAVARQLLKKYLGKRRFFSSSYWMSTVLSKLLTK